MEICTIGFTQTSAADFFGRLKAAGLKRLIDVRLNNSSQLAGFAKRDDLSFFLREICGVDYRHEPLLAPTQDMLDAYKKRRGAWDEYAERFLDLMAERRIEANLDSTMFREPCVLLCSEPEATYCHRRLVVEYLAGHWSELQARHL